MCLFNHAHHHQFRLLLSPDTRNLIYMSKQYRRTCNIQFTKHRTWNAGGELRR